MRAPARAAAIAALLMAAAGWLDAGHTQTAAGVPADLAALEGQHPSEYYRRTAALLRDGRNDDAVFVFYLGQLRYRAHLLARPGLRPDGDPALFASLSQMVGRPVNEYAFGDIPALVRTIDAVLTYDLANPDRFTSPSEFPQACASVREGLIAMRAKVLADADSIRAKRKENGLENRK